MHIVLISGDSVPNPGGVAAHVFNLSMAMRAAGARVTVLGGTNRRELLANFLPPFETFRTHLIPGTPKLAGAEFVLWARRQLKQLLKRDTVDVIHVHTIPTDGAIFLQLPRTIRCIATNHSSGFLSDYASRRRQLMYRLLFRNCSAIIAPSQELAIKSTYLGVTRNRIHYIPNGVDTTRFFPAEPSGHAWDRIHPFSPENEVVLSTRRLEPKNGVRHLVEAIPTVLAHCPNARFVIAGDGRERQALDRLVNRLRITRRVKFLGNQPNDTLPDLYRLASVCVLPSLMEATSISGLEAMACGKPLVGTTVGGLPEIIAEQDTGYLVPPGDTSALAEAIVRVLSSPEQAARFGQEATRRVSERFSWGQIAKRTLEVYQSSLSAAPQALPERRGEDRASS